MKKNCFILSFTAIAALAACSTQELESPANLQNGMLMVRPIMPEVEIETKADLPTIYAFIPEELNAGTVNPVLPKINSGNTYYYNLEGVGSDVIFSNMDFTSPVYPRYDENGFSLVKTDQYSADLGNELLFGVATGIQTGNTEPYEVRLNRFSSSVQFKFMAYDTDGNELPAETFQYADATLGGFATELRFGSDITTSAPAPYGNTSIAESAALQDGQWLSTPRNVIPGTEQMDYDVNITLSDGTSGNFKGSLGRTLEANHSYIITFRMKKANGSASFTLEEPEVHESNFTLYPSEQKMFRVKSSYAVGKDEGSTVSFYVSTEIPYEWSYELIEGSEYFSVTQDNDKLTVTALSANETESRTGLLMLRTTEGHEQPVYISQMNGSRQVIYLTKHDNQTTEFTITGSNIEIDYGSGFIPYDDGGNIRLTGDIFANGTTATIIADGISSFTETDGTSAKYSYGFENCVTLTELTANIYDSAFDFSNLPALKTLALDDSNLTEITFAEGQDIESLSLRNGEFTALNLNSIAGSLKKLDCDSNTNLTSLEIYPSDYTGELIIESLNIQGTNLADINCSNHTHLENLNISGCQSMETVNLNGCTSLKELDFRGNYATYLNISNCPVLRALTFDENYLNIIDRAGSDMIETINIGRANITNFDFSNMPSLQSIVISSYLKCNYFNISNCPNVKIKSTGNDYTVYGIEIDNLNVDIRNCTSLDYIGFAHLSSWKIDNTPNIKKLAIYYSGPEVYTYDFSKHPNVEVIKLDDIGYNSDTEPEFNLDLSGCPALKTLHVSETPLTSLNLPQSLETLELKDWQDGLTCTSELNLSGYANLKKVDISGGGPLRSLILSGCIALETCNIRDINGENATVDLFECSSLKDCSISQNPGLTSINFFGCTAPMKLYLYGNETLPSLDLSNTGVAEFEIRFHLALTSISLNNCQLLELCTIFQTGELISIDASNCPVLKRFDTFGIPKVENINVSGCYSLERFEFSNSSLIGIDFSSCQKLKYVDVKNNLMEADGLDAMLNSLCDRSFEATTGQIYISGNPGENECNKNIAMDKNWYFE